AAVGGAEADVVHTAVSEATALCAHGEVVARADDPVDGGVAVAETVRQLVLPDGRDGDRDGPAVGIGHTRDARPHVLVVRRPEVRAGRGAGARRVVVHVHRRAAR